MVATDIVLQLFCPSTYHWLYTKTERIDKVAMMFDIVAPIGYAAHIYWFAMPLKEYV